jgi:hypothetical protein
MAAERFGQRRLRHGTRVLLVARLSSRQPDGHAMPPNAAKGRMRFRGVVATSAA